MFNAESLGSRCPDNWLEIIEYLNNKINDGNDPEEIWENYCSGAYPDAPDAIFE